MKTQRLVVTALVCGLLVVCASAARGQAIPKFVAIGSNGTTQDKPQSKLWYHDGSWWAILPTNGTGLYFYRMVNGVFEKQTFPVAQVDTDNKKYVDVLSKGNDLFAIVYKTRKSTPDISQIQVQRVDDDIRACG